MSSVIVDKMPVIPLRGIAVFPHMALHLDVGRDRSVAAIDEAMDGNKEVLLVLQREASIDEPNEEDIYEYGTVGKVKQILKLPGGTLRILAEGMYRGKIQKMMQVKPYMSASVVTLPDEEVSPDDMELSIEALMRSARDEFESFIGAHRRIPADALLLVNEVEEPGQLADMISAYLNLRANEKQMLIEATDIQERLMLLITMLIKEKELLNIEREIDLKVKRQIDKSQKEYYLREQLKVVQKELGEGDDRTSEVEELKKRVEETDLPDYVEEKIEKEIDRLSKMPTMMAEGMVVRTYIEWLLDLPWIKESRDNLDINKAKKILDEDHYGLEKPKERILEFLAVRKLSKKLKGQIICLVGPPGVGKTSLAKSIARAINRKFVRMSLGGVRDEAEIRGHRRTYVGAMPGRIIQNMKIADRKNPLFLLDEVDKMGKDFRGDPASAFLEVLDPEQNNTFTDHYIELPFDLSKVMFITTANLASEIPAPLLDRMEIIDLSGYIEEEKWQIAVRHLIPKQLKENGLTAKQIDFSEGAIRKIIREYTREAGVRNLERSIGTICRKVAKDIVSKKIKSQKIIVTSIEKYLGIPRYRHEEARKEDRIGVATGLAWTQAGGELLNMEVKALAGKGKSTITGHLGDVMKESAWAGYTFIRSKAAELKIDKDFDKLDLHIHVPAGAVPKDGPSAGITLATAIASELTNRPVKHNIAMTGEISLHGKVLPVGGIKEKLLAAYIAGSDTVIMPEENKKDLEEIPENIRKNLKINLVENMTEVLDLALLPKVDKK